MYINKCNLTYFNYIHNYMTEHFFAAEASLHRKKRNVHQRNAWKHRLIFSME